MPDFSIHASRVWDFVLFGVIALLIASCASMQTPTGGPRDKTPPVVISESPKNLTKNFHAKKVEIEFNEFIKPSIDVKEISISPTFEKFPEFKVRKKVLEIIFQDTLQKQTTYTINFGKSIADYNEGNVLKNYSFVFSTGDVIDSLSISGNVINATTRKPATDITVILVPEKQDTLFTKKSASVFAITDSAGNYRLNNLKEGNYHLFALKEQGGGDRIYNSSNEEIGFLGETIQLKKNTTVPPITMFKEVPATFRLFDHKIQPDGRITMIYNKPIIDPTVRIINLPDLDRRKYVEFVPTRDSATIWLPEMTFDSVEVELSGKGIPIDTIHYPRSKTTTYNNIVNIKTNVDNSKLRERSDLVLTFSSKISTLDDRKITLLADSIPIEEISLQKDSLSARNLRIKYNWKRKTAYIIRVADNAVTSISGGKNKLFSDGFFLSTDDNYGSLPLTITVPDSLQIPFIIQVIRGDNEVVASRTLTKNEVVTFAGLSPGSYLVRAIYDKNKNGLWDTGDLKAKTQPELIWTVSKVLTVRANSDSRYEIPIPLSP